MRVCPLNILFLHIFWGEGEVYGSIKLLGRPEFTCWFQTLIAKLDSEFPERRQNCFCRSLFSPADGRRAKFPTRLSKSTCCSVSRPPPGDPSRLFLRECGAARAEWTRFVLKLGSSEDPAEVSCPGFGCTSQWRQQRRLRPGGAEVLQDPSPP